MSANSKIQLGILNDTYGALLTEKQKSIVDLFCNFDFSLQEIAEQLGISRQAVLDAIATVKKTFLQLEKGLRLIEIKTSFKSTIELAKQKLSEGQLDELKILLESASKEV